MAQRYDKGTPYRGRGLENLHFFVREHQKICILLQNELFESIETSLMGITWHDEVSRSSTYSNTRQKVTFRIAKGDLLNDKRWPFAIQKVTVYYVIYFTLIFNTLQQTPSLS